MENTTASKYTISFGFSLALCSVINALIVIAKEKSPAVMSGMARVTGHHWITHTAIVLILFALFGWLFARSGNARGGTMAAGRLIGIIAAGVVASGVIIIGFYLIAD